ncbi:hypothetical protein THRCLA_04887 [Thraustotheca clavata]|uniref:Uncharacterized protein n=1 Tax=Thraustotheca clavata TaxID=74557 RepID=A0A1V9ZXP0_9STRA|nr:hypothetical protein THRCLA_04887 [Thraustotheca clavata]
MNLTAPAALNLATFLQSLASVPLKSTYLGRDYGSVRVLSHHVVCNSKNKELTLGGLCVNTFNNTILVCDLEHSCIRILDFATRQVIHTLGSRGSNPGKFIEPVGIAFNAINGQFAVSDTKVNRIQIFSLQYQLVAHFGRSGSSRDQFNGVMGITFTPNGHHLVIADSGNHRIKIVTPTGAFLREFGTFGDGCTQFNYPCDVAVNRVGDIFVGDRDNHRIQVFSNAGEFRTLWTNPLKYPHSLAIMPEHDTCGDTGDIVVCDTDRILVFSQTGILAFQLPLTNTTGIAYHNRHFIITHANSVTFCAPYTIIPAGKLQILPVVVFEQILNFIAYKDAIALRQTNRFYHRTCKHLRDTWQLYPLTQGKPPELKYGKFVAKPTGLVAIHELYTKWGEHSYAKIPSKIRNGLVFQTNFQGAICEHFGPMFWFQHEASLAIVFQYYTQSDKTLKREGFIELITVLTEIQTNVLEWHQCRAFMDLKRPVPARRKQNANKLEQLESSQSYQLDKLMSKLKAMV